MGLALKVILLSKHLDTFKLTNWVDLRTEELENTAKTIRPKYSVTCYCTS